MVYPTGPQLKGPLCSRGAQSLRGGLVWVLIQGRMTCPASFVTLEFLGFSSITKLIGFVRGPLPCATLTERRLSRGLSRSSDPKAR